MLTKINLIAVFLLFAFSGQAQLMDSIIFSSNGTQISNSPSGVAYDPGGPQSGYWDNQNAGLVLNINCATNITITVHEYSVETCCDVLQFYDGSDINGAFLGAANYQSLPFTVSSTGNQLFLRWVTDGSVTSSGFRLTWESTVVSADPPIASILVNNDNPALSEKVQFQVGPSDNLLLWEWDFGDGSTANIYNPEHAWHQPGNYNVSLIVTNCQGEKDTATQVITVQQAPMLSVNPSLLQLNAGCGDTATALLTLTNTGPGDLLFSGSANTGGKKKILVYNYNANQQSLLGITNILNLYPDDYEVLVAHFIDNASAQTLLDHHDIVIFPALDFTDPWVLMPYAAQIQQFIQDGGSVVHCAQIGYNTGLSAFGYFLNTNATTYEYTNQNLVTNTNHPITTNIPANLSIPFYAGGILINEPNYVSLANAQDASLLGYLNLPKGNVVYIGSGFQTFNLNMLNLLRNTLDWCGKKEVFQTFPASGIIEPGSSQQIQLVIPTFGLTPGNYNGVVNINTNNPAQTSVEVPFELQLTGQAQLLVTPSIAAFDSIMQFSNDSIGLTLMNIGCDTLFITDISSSNPAFTIGTDSFVIAPYATAFVGTIFHPLDTGAYAGQFIFQTNTGTLQTQATGYALGAPVLSLNPDSVAVTIACGDSTSVEVIVSNTGLSALDVNLSGTNIGIGDTIDVIVLNFLSYNWGNTSVSYNMQNWMVNRFPDVPTRVYNFSGSTVAELENILQTMDVALIPFAVYNGVLDPTEVGLALKSFMNGGGSLILSGTTFSDFFNQLGLSSSNSNYVSNWLPGQVLDAGHPLMKNLAFTTAPYDNMISQQFNDPEMIDVMVITPDIVRSAVSYKPFGNGKMIYLGYEYYQDHPEVVELLGNSLRWNSKNATVSASNNSFTLQPGDSQIVTINIKAQNLNAGVYTTNLYFNSNDPVHPQVTLPITMTIEGMAQLSVSANNINYGLIQQFSTQIRSINIENTGCDTLFITGIDASTAELSLDFATTYILAGETLPVYINLSANLPGNFSGNINLLTNGGNQTVIISAIVIGAPVANLNPGSLTQQLDCRDTAFQQITLQNTGLSGLTYDLGLNTPGRKIVLLGYGAEQPRTSTMTGYLLNTVPNIQLSTLNVLESKALRDSLAKADMLILPPFSGIDPSQLDSFEAFAPVIQAFLDKGKTVLITGISNTAPLLRMNMFSSDFTADIDLNPVITQQIGSHPLTYNLPRQFQAGNEYIGGINFSPNDQFVTTWKSANGSTYFGYRVKGNGVIAYFGASFNGLSTEALTLFGNANQWAANPIPPGVEMSYNSGAVAIGNAETIDVSFSSVGLPGGQYQGFIRMATNDPLHPTVQIPVVVNVSQQPCTNFSYQSSLCGGSVQFTDQSLNGVFSWYWQFGDGFDAFSINPVHNYATAGTYEVTLVACNGVGCDTLVQTIQVSGNVGPVSAACMPGSSNAICCETGIYYVSFHTLNNFSDGAPEGYQDNSCNLGTELVAGLAYPLLVRTSNNTQEYIRVWIDYNNNGIFSPNELVLTDINYLTHSATVQIPTTAVKNTPLRMRIVSESFNYSPPGGCSTPNNGQVEDYYVIIKNSSDASDVTNDQQFKLYPNPSFGNVWLEITQEIREEATLTIMDETGRLVYESAIKTQDTNAVQIPDLPAGTYMVRVQTSDWTQTKKLIRMD